MKTIGLLLTLLLIFTTSVFAAAPDTVISQEALMNMTDVERNAVFEGLKKQAKLHEAAKTVTPETLKTLANMDVETFKGKAMATADTLVLFFDKLGVKANEFINTPVGLLTALGIIYKMGVFQGIWSSVVSILSILIFLTILYKLNTKKIVSIQTRDKKGEIIGTEDKLVPKFTAVLSDDNDSYTAYAVFGSIVCIVIIVVILCNM